MSTLISRLMVLLALAMCLTIGGCGPKAPERVDGVYLEDNKDTPVQARFRLEIHADGKWVMGSAATKFSGTWKKSGDGLTFTYLGKRDAKLDMPDLVPITFPDNDSLVLGDSRGSVKFKREPSEHFVLPLD